MIIKYFNQALTRDKDGNQLGDWKDVCHGHNLPYDAIACTDYQRAIIDGKHAPETITEAIALSYFEHQRALGNQIELRIIKRTTTDEVYDA